MAMYSKWWKLFSFRRILLYKWNLWKIGMQLFSLLIGEAREPWKKSVLLQGVKTLNDQPLVSTYCLSCVFGGMKYKKEGSFR